MKEMKDMGRGKPLFQMVTHMKDCMKMEKDMVRVYTGILKDILKEQILFPFQNTRISCKSIFKEFVDIKIIVAKQIEFISNRIKNIVGKVEGLVTTILSFIHNVF